MMCKKYVQFIIILYGYILGMLMCFFCKPDFSCLNKSAYFILTLLLCMFRLKPIQKPTPRRTKAGSRNPLKTMSQHITLQSEYREESTGIAERELKRIKKERGIENG